VSGGRKTANEIRLHGSREQCTVHGQALGYARVLSLGGQVGELGRLRDAPVVDVVARVDERTGSAGVLSQDLVRLRLGLRLRGRDRG
jgi:hypothetical protein